MLAQIKAELANLQDVELVRHYGAIGQRISRISNLPPSLATHAEAIRRIETSTAQGDVEPGSIASNELRAAYVTLGRDAVAQYGAKAIPKELAPLEEQRCRSRRQQKWLGVAAVTVAAIATACVALAFRGVSNLEPQHPVSAEAAQEPFAMSKADTEAAVGDLFSALQVNKDDLQRAEKALSDSAEKIVSGATKGLAALKTKGSVQAIHKALDAVLEEWKKTSRELLSSFPHIAIVKQLPILADPDIRRKALGRIASTLESALDRISEDLAGQVVSKKESIEYAFGGVDDAGRRFDRPAAERNQIIGQSVASLSEGFGQATEQLSSELKSVLRNVVDLQESYATEAKSLLETLQSDLQESRRRWDSGSGELLASLRSLVESRDDIPEETLRNASGVAAKFTSAVEAETKVIADGAADGVNRCAALVSKGTSLEIIRAKTREASLAVSNHVERSLRKLDDDSKADRKVLLVAMRQARAEDPAADESGNETRPVATARSGGDTPDESQVKTSPPPAPYDGEIDPAVLDVLGDVSEEYTEHGFGGIELGQTYDHVNRSVNLARVDARYPWKFLSREEDQYFVFDDKDKLRVYGREYNGGPDINAEKILSLFGPTSNQKITRKVFNAKSGTESTMFLYLLPEAGVIALVEFRQSRFVRFRDVETAEKTSVVVMDLQWALPILHRSAALKRPILEWMKVAAERVASGSCNVDDMPLPPGTGMLVKKESEKQVTGILVDGGEGGRGKPKKQRHLGWAKCVSEDLLPYAQARRGTVGVEVNFGNYTCLESNVLLKQHPRDDGSPPPPAEAIKEAPLLSLLEDEVTKQLLMEYFEPNSGKYAYVPDDRGGVTVGLGRYEWKCLGILDAVFEAVSNTNGSSAVFYLTRRSL
jgi:hypothetical protein